MRWWPFGSPDPVQQRRNEVEMLKLKLEARTLQTLTESVSLNNSFVNPADIYGPDQGWNDLPYGLGGLSVPMDRNQQGSLPQAYLGEQQLKWARERSRFLSVNNEFARNALETRKNYIVGQGFQVTPVARQEGQELDAALETSIKEWMQEFEAVNRWGQLQREGVFRGDRDGEAFFRLFRLANGMMQVRFIEPEFVKDSGGDAPFGIVTDAEDIASVVAFKVQYPGRNTETVAAEDVVFAKCNTDQGVKRGLPFLYPIHEILNKVERLDDTMVTTARVQASYAVIRKSSGGARKSSITTNNAQNTSYTVSNPLTGGTDNFRQMRGGMIVDTDANTEYEFPAAGVSIPGFVAAKESMLRTAAAGAGMPEYMFTSDSSNGNFASTQVAESPSVMNFMAWQAFWQHIYGNGVYVEGADSGILWRAIKWAVDAGRLPAEVLEKVRLKCQGPQVIVRDRLQETQRLQMLEQAGVIDNDQWATEEGYSEPAQSSEDKMAREDQQQADQLAAKQKNSSAVPKK